jgi:hypothetical protein
VLSALAFVAAWALLDVSFNLRYPALDDEPALWYFLPSIDVCVLLGIFSLLGWRGWRIPIAVTAVLAILVLAVRLFRVAEGLVQRNYYRSVNLAIDLPLLPDLWRFLRSTVPTARFVRGALLVALVLTAALALLFAALLHAQRFLASGSRGRSLLASVLAVCAGLWPLWHADRSSALHHGLFGASVAPALLEQIRMARSAAQVRRVKSAEIRAVQDRLRHTPADLQRLQGADVLMFLVESYGSAVFHDPYLVGRLCPALGPFSTAMAQHGFFTASSLLDSTTYGGGSWWAHATLATGVSVRNEVEFAVAQQLEPPPRTMQDMFRQAGYRTVLVAPGAIRPWPDGARGFDRKYHNRDLEYEGPPFGWWTVSDEYVLDFIHRREVAPARTPLFVQYALVSSHAHWMIEPQAVHDWSRLEHGHIYRHSHVAQFPHHTDDAQANAAAYAYSLCYDFDILQHYLTELITRDTLIVILGDHQPPGDITHHDPSWAVPVHVISRNRALIDRFAAAGYVAGMIPPGTGSIAGFETFLPDLLALLSRGPTP